MVTFTEYFYSDLFVEYETVRLYIWEKRKVYKFLMEKQEGRVFGRHRRRWGIILKCISKR